MIMDRLTVVELLMHKLNKKNLYRESCKILNDGEFRTNQLKEYKELTEKMGEPNASSRFAALMLKELRK